MKARALSTILQFEFANLDDLNSQAQVDPALNSMAERLLDRFNPSPRPKTSMVLEILVDECLRIEQDPRTKPHQHFNIMAQRIIDYFEAMQSTAPKPLPGLPNNPFKK